MNWIDIIILAVLSISVLIGLWRGLISEMLALAIWGVAFWVSWTFGPGLAAAFDHSISLPSARLAIGYSICFVGVLVAGAILKAMVSRMLIRSGLSGPDRLLGMAFGLARGVLLVSLMVFLFGLTSITREAWWSGSALLPQFQSVATWLGGQMPPSATQYLHSAPAVMNQLPSMHMPDLHGLSGTGGLPDLRSLGQSGANGTNTANGSNNLFDLHSLQGLPGVGNLQGLRNLPGLPGTSPAAPAPSPAATAVTPMYIR